MSSSCQYCSSYVFARTNTRKQRFRCLGENFIFHNESIFSTSYEIILDATKKPECSISQLAFPRSKLIETVEQGAKYVQSELIKLWTYFKPCSSVNCEHVITRWVNTFKGNAFFLDILNFQGVFIGNELKLINELSLYSLAIRVLSKRIQC